MYDGEDRRKHLRVSGNWQANVTISFGEPAAQEIVLNLSLSGFFFRSIRKYPKYRRIEIDLFLNDQSSIRATATIVRSSPIAGGLIAYGAKFLSLPEADEARLSAYLSTLIA